MLIIFDLDDTLIDTSGSITPIVLQNALKEMILHGLKVDSFPVAYQTLLACNEKAKNAKEGIKDFLHTLSCFEESLYEKGIHAVYNLTKLPHGIKVELQNGAAELLSFLQKKEIRMAITTIGNRLFQREKMKKAGLDSLSFCKIVITKQKNKQAVYKKILKEFSLSPTSVIVCGDKVDIDLMPAKNLGCTTVHMRKGRGKAYIANAFVDYSISNLTEIIPIITTKLS